MSIVKWLVQKTKQLVPVTDENQHEEWLKKNRLISRINEEERLKSLSKKDIADEAWAKIYPRRIESICNDCGFYVSGCLCGWRKSDQESQS